MMRLTLIALLAAFGIFTGVETRAHEGATVWLILRYGTLNANSLEKVPMPTMEQCQMQGAIWESSKNISNSGRMGFECLEGNQ